MSSFGSKDLQKEVVDGLESATQGTEFEVTDELKDTKRLCAQLDRDDCCFGLDIDIKDEYVSVKHNIHDGDSSINVKQRFFDTGDDAVEWIEDLIREISDS